MILMALLISGASAGSTAGGIKVARIVMLFKGLKAEVMRAVKPRRVVTICMDGKRIDASVMRGTYGYVAAFVAICAASMLLVSLDNFDFTTTVTGVLTCIGNVGPGLSMVGPSGNFSAFPTQASWCFRLTCYSAALRYSRSYSCSAQGSGGEGGNTKRLHRLRGRGAVLFSFHLHIFFDLRII